MPITQAAFYRAAGKYTRLSGTRLQYDNWIWKEISGCVRVNASDTSWICPQNNEDGSTRVEPLRGSNGRPISIILRFLSILSDAFTLLLKKLYEIFDKISYKGKQSLKTFPMRLPRYKRSPISITGRQQLSESVPPSQSWEIFASRRTFERVALRFS